MKPIFLLLFLLSIALQGFGQVHRRANYYETFIEVNTPIDSIVVLKSKRQMICFHQKQKVKMYMISLGMEPEGKSNLKVICEHQKDFIPSMVEIQIVHIIPTLVYLIQTQKILLLLPYKKKCWWRNQNSWLPE